jgi:glycine cleavage system regulatory protein
MESLVVTVVGADRPGLVSLLSDRGRQHGASWEESRMASLAGQFAGIVHFQVPDESAAALTHALRDLESMGLNVQVVQAGHVEHGMFGGPVDETGQPAAPGAGSAGATAARASSALELELVGQDRPGIIRDISRAIADLGVSIQELSTEVSSAAMSGEHLFHASALLQVPSTVATADLQRVLEAIANELMVDVRLQGLQGLQRPQSGSRPT